MRRVVQEVNVSMVFLAFLFLGATAAGAYECDLPASDYGVLHTGKTQGDASLDKDSFFTEENNLRDVVSIYPHGPPPEGGFPVVLSLSLNVSNRSAEDYFCILTTDYCKTEEPGNQFCYSIRYRNQIYKSLVEAGYAVVAPAAWASDSWFFGASPLTPPPVGECCGEGRFLKSLSDPAVSGATEIELNNSDGIEYRDGKLKYTYLLRISLDSGIDYRTVTAVSGTTFTVDAGLTGEASAGNEVQMLNKNDCNCSWPASDEAFFKVFFDDLDSGAFGPLNSESMQMMGWSGGASMTSRGMNNFPLMTTRTGKALPKIERAMLLSGGSYECYSERYTPDCDPNKYPYENCCPKNTTEANFGEPPAPLSWAEHPPVLSCQAEPDRNADAETSEIYTRVMEENGVPAKRVVWKLTEERCQEYFGISLEHCAGHFFFPDMQQPTVVWLTVPEPGGFASHFVALAALAFMSANRRGKRWLRRSL